MYSYFYRIKCALYLDAKKFRKNYESLMNIFDRVKDVD
jgi:hypothetical protein